MSIIEIQNVKQFNQFISTHEYPIITYFTASWCRPCFELQKLIEQKLSCNFGWIVLKVNVDNEDIVSCHEILSIPSVFFYKDGDVFEVGDAFFQGYDGEALTRMIDLANKNSQKSNIQPSL